MECGQNLRIIRVRRLKKMNDPYSVLGLSSSASEEEVKKAYKTLAKKYHPDVAGNSPEAAKKMQEINAAYDAIINHKSYGYQNSGSSYNSYYDYGQKEEESNEMRAAASYINARRFQEALHVLSTVKVENRNARWYYLMSIASYYNGDTNAAYSNISEAIKREPNNLQYQSFLDRLRSGRQFYTTKQNSYSSNNGFFSCCIPLVLLNLFCPGYFCIC